MSRCIVHGCRGEKVTALYCGEHRSRQALWDTLKAGEVKTTVEAFKVLDGLQVLGKAVHAQESQRLVSRGGTAKSWDEVSDEGKADYCQDAMAAVMAWEARKT